MIRLLIVSGLLLFLPLTGKAVTLQGTDTVAIQGQQSTILPSADSDELAHGFADLAGWSTSGTVSIFSGKLRVITATTGSDWARSSAQTVRSEYWLQFEYEPDSISDLSNNERTFGTGLRSSTLGNIATVGVQGIGANKHWYVRWKTDAGEDSNFGDATSPQILTGTVYTVVLHWKAASAVVANDGILQVWTIANGAVSTLVDLNDIDSDTVTANLFQAGNFDSSGIIATILIDDLNMGTTGQVYVP